MSLAQARGANIVAQLTAAGIAAGRLRLLEAAAIESSGEVAARLELLAARAVAGE